MSVGKMSVVAFPNPLRTGTGVVKVKSLPCNDFHHITTPGEAVESGGGVGGENGVLRG